MLQVELKEGPLSQFSHEMEPFLRKQGMPVRLNKGMLSSILPLFRISVASPWKISKAGRKNVNID